MTDSDIQAIIVSEETMTGAHKINELRSEKSFPPLDVVCVSLVSNAPDLVHSSLIVYNEANSATQGGQEADLKLSSTLLRKLAWEKLQAAKDSVQ